MKAPVSDCQRSEPAWCQQYFSWPVAGLQGTQSPCSRLTPAAHVPESRQSCTCRQRGGTRGLFPSGSFSWPPLNPIVFITGSLFDTQDMEPQSTTPPLPQVCSSSMVQATIKTPICHRGESAMVTLKSGYKGPARNKLVTFYVP